MLKRPQMIWVPPFLEITGVPEGLLLSHRFRRMDESLFNAQRCGGRQRELVGNVGVAPHSEKHGVGEPNVHRV